MVKADLSRMVAAAGLLVGVVGFSAAASAGGAKVDVCHVNGQGDYQLISVSENAFDQHVAHGDATVGDPVPGMDGFEFDGDCAPDFTEVIYAVAYTDIDPDDGPYNREVDVFIAKLVEASGDNVPGVGDRVIVGRYPLSVNPPFTFGDTAWPGGPPDRVVIGVDTRLVANCTVSTLDNGIPASYLWSAARTEGEKFTVPGSLGMKDRFNQPLIGDSLSVRSDLNSGFPIYPTVTGNFSSGPPDGETDNQYVDVEINC